jgi:hypothetical protein
VLTKSYLGDGRFSRVAACFVAGALTAFGCDSSNPGGSSDAADAADASDGGDMADGADVTALAQVTLHLDVVASSGGCLSVLSASTETRHDKFPTGTKEVVLDGLPTGTVVFTVESSPDACGIVVANKSPVTQAGGPIVAILKPGANSVDVVMRAVQGAAVSVGYDPNAIPVCGLPGSPCTTNEGCCSLRCTGVRPGTSGTGACRADEPPAPPGPRLQQNPSSLKAVNAGAAYPSRDGDFFFVGFPNSSDVGPNDGTASAVRAAYVTPALEGTGFSRSMEVITPTAPEPRELPGGNFARLMTTICENEGRDGMGAQICNYLRGFQSPPGTDALVEDISGMTSADMSTEVNRKALFWVFPQMERGVSIEHKGVIAVRYENRRVSSVFGAVINSHRVVNVPGLNPESATARARPTLMKLESITSDNKLGPQPQLVLLPYGAPRDDKSGTTTALRFAYRTVMSGHRPIAGGSRTLSFMVWVDAQDGTLLKYVPLSGELQLKPWCRDPSDGSPNCLVSSDDYNLATAAASSPGSPTAWNNRFEIRAGDNMPPRTDPSTPLANELCSAHSGFRQVNTLAHLQRAYSLLKEGGKFIDFTNKVKVMVDAPGDENFANFDDLTIDLVRGGAGLAACSQTPGVVLAGSQDASVITHEFAHLATMQMQTARSATSCSGSSCATPNPYNRRFFHDYADGLAAMFSDSPCIGGWSAKNREHPPNQSVGAGGVSRVDVTRACARADENSQLPRLLYAGNDQSSAFHDQLAFEMARSGIVGDMRIDTFPNHRWGMGGASGDYADGQIVGAALWHLWQGTRSQALVAGTPTLWGRLNQGIAMTGFGTTQCPFDSESCDSNVYRGGRELLYQLTAAWLNSPAEGRRSTNKLLSAFARAGVYLTPTTCLGANSGSGLATTDSQFCANGLSGADAIVDISDGVPDGTQSLGIQFEDEDFVSRLDTVPPTFRVWTGVPFRFGGDPLDPGRATEDNTLCNTNMRVQFRVSGTTGYVGDGMKQLAAGHKCFDTWTPDPVWWRDVFLAQHAPGQTRIRVEYKATTWSGDGSLADPTLRDSANPGNGVWPNTNVHAAFWVTNRGAP